MRLLLTGASGFLGGYLCRAAREAGWHITAAGRSSPSQPVDCFVQCDLAGPEPVTFGQPFQQVIHAAGLAHSVPQNQEDAERFFQVNVRGAANLLSALERSGDMPNCFVLISTVAVYGAETGQLLSEQTPRRAEDPYGRSRMEAEDLVLDWGRQNGVPVVVLRLPLVAGAGAPGNLGAMVRALRCRRYLGIGSGKARRSMVRAADVARLAVQPDLPPGVYHLTDGEHPSFAEVEAALCKALARRPPPRIPVAAALAAGAAGSLLSRVTGRRFPLTLAVVKKMSSTLTFDDSLARQKLDWAPAPVLADAADLTQ